MVSLQPPAQVAVVGSGVSGLVAAYVASRTSRVTLFEADDRIGGHADTHTVVESTPTGDRTLGIDTGFIVHNRRTYPVLLRLFAELGVATQESDMSMSVRDDGTGLEWAGAMGRRGLFPTRDNLSRPAYLRMLVEIPRFHRRARSLLAQPAERPDVTLREFLVAGRFSAYFTRHFMEPVVAAVWSCDPEVALEYPARYLFSFLQHHGMLAIFGSPPWRTVTGGSRTYVARVAAQLDAAGSEIRTGAKVTSILERADGVEVTDGNGGVTRFDAVVVATHPGHTLTMLAEPTDTQRELLGAMPYSANTALLHTDTSVLPRARNAWASWNFTRPTRSQGQVVVTYDLTRLQRLDTDTHYLVTLGGEDTIDPALVIDRMEYEHPLYNPASVSAQQRLASIATDRVAFAGAYHGWGFHEDGARSGLAAAERLGLTWPEEEADESARARTGAAVTGVYDTTVRHTRRTPFHRSFTTRSHTWVVDLDDLPDHGVLGRFVARDHLGSPDRSIRDNLQTFLATEDVTLDTEGRVLMAANARAFGYNFNPISVFWCFTRAGALEATVVEVHNTYGDRHAYLVQPDEQGRATTAKAMYVSPFHGTDGSYDLTVPVPGEQLLVSVSLDSDEGARFSASMTGVRSGSPDSTRAARRAAPAALSGSALIRSHGLRLWLRRLPIRPRPQHHQEGVS